MSETETTEEVKKGPKVGEIVQAAIKAGATNEEALEEVLSKVDGAKTSLASVNWYRQKMRQEDPSILTSRELKKQRAAAAESEDGGFDDE